VPKKKMSFDRVRAIGLALPGVVEGTAYGAPALKVRGKMFACIASNRSAEPNTLVVRLPFDDRDELVVAQPDVYYLKDHYVPYACVLIRLDRVSEEVLQELLLMGHRFITKAKQPRTSR
jgi:hypothetical protein